MCCFNSNRTEYNKKKHVPIERNCFNYTYHSIKWNLKFFSLCKIRILIEREAASNQTSTKS